MTKSYFLGLSCYHDIKNLCVKWQTTDHVKMENLKILKAISPRLAINILPNIFIKFRNNIFLRLIGVVSASLIFFIFSNFGVWVLGSYGYSYEGLITCYIAAIPFYTNTLLSTIIYSVIIETILNFYKSNKKNLILKN